MFFPILRNMKKYQINEVCYNTLDSWLASRRQATRKCLNPLQFSVDAGIDFEMSLALFAICTYPDINLLRTKYIVECLKCKRILGVYYDIAEIQDSYECEECSGDHCFVCDDVIICFELLQEPEKTVFNQVVEEAIKKVTNFPGKSRSLRISDVKKSSNPAVRGLMGKYDERFISAK